MMKKVLLSMMFCFGVGLAMMASPAQGADDDNLGSNEQAVTAVSDRPAAPKDQPSKFKYQIKFKKKVDNSKFRVSKRSWQYNPYNPGGDSGSSNPTQTQYDVHNKTLNKVGKTPWGNNPGNQPANPDTGGGSGSGGNGTHNTNDWRNNPVTECTGHTIPTSTY